MIPVSSGGVVLPHIRYRSTDMTPSTPPLIPSFCRGQVALGFDRLFCPCLLTVPGHERIGSLPVSLHCGEIHCYLSSHEGSGAHYLEIKIMHHPKL